MDHATGQRRPRRAITPGARRHLFRTVAAVFLLLQGLLVTSVPASADTTSASTWGPQFPPSCPTGTYAVPAGTRYVEVIAIGGAGRGGWTFNDNNTGGPGGSGARVRAILPVTAGQVFKVVVAHNGDAADPSEGYPKGGATPFASGKGGGSSVVTSFAGDPCLGAAAPRSEIMVLAGGGGGGGGGGTFGSGGAGGNAGANIDLSGQAGSRAYGLSTDTANGSGGGGGTVTAAGSGGAAAAPSIALATASPVQASPGGAAARHSTMMLGARRQGVPAAAGTTVVAAAAPGTRSAAAAAARAPATSRPPTTPSASARTRAASLRSPSPRWRTRRPRPR